jgi:hypothetical protein
MNPTTNPNFTKQIVNMFLSIIPNGTIWAFKLVFGIIKTFVFSNLIAVTIILLVVLAYAVLMALMGEWWILGKVLHKYLYWGSGFIIALIWGPEVFTGTYMDLWLYILSIICFIVVGIILNKTGLQRRF